MDENLLAIPNSHELILELVRIKHFQGDTSAMNLKLVVAMSILGLVSCPTYAATQQSKHKTHHQKSHHHHHHAMKQQAAAAPADYKGMDYKDMAPAPVCTISQASLTMDEMTQSVGRAMPNPCDPGWFNRIQVSGGLNVDIGKWGNRNTQYMGENYQRLSLNDVYLNVSATVNDWAKAFASLSYNTATTNFNPGDPSNPGVNNAEYSAAYSNNINGTPNNDIQLEQAYMTLGNLDQSPIFVQIGKQFQDFSRYEIHPITRSMTQVMSETLATSAKVGFIVPMGFNGSIYAFDDPLTKNNGGSTTTNYGAALGFDQPNDQLGWDLGVAYLYNLIGANDVAYSVVNFTGSNFYHNRVGAVAAYGDVNSGPFNLMARYTTAVQRFNILDLPENGVAASTTGAKPWTATAQAGYGYQLWGYNQGLYIGYQASGEAAGLNIPKSRWLAGLGVDVWKNTNFGIEWDHDNDYSTAKGGGQGTTNLVSLRAAVKFG